MLGVEHVAEPEQMADPLLNSDLFDAEDSSDSERVLSPRSPLQQSQPNRVFSDADSNDGDVRNDIDSDGEERTSPRPDVSERSKPKRKPRTPRAKKPRRPKRSEVQEIHSETQRIVRESSLRLPYHKPVKKSIDDFFNKKPSSPFLKPVPLKGVKKLNGGLTAHKHSNGDSKKHSKLSSNKTNKLQLNVATSETSKQDSGADSLKLPSTPVEDFPIVENWLKDIQLPKRDEPISSQSLENSEELISLEQTESNTDKLGVVEDNLTNSEDVEDSLHLTGILSQTQDESQEYTKEDVVAAEESVQPYGADKLDSVEPCQNASTATSVPRVDIALEHQDGADKPVQEIVKEPDQSGNVDAHQVSNDTEAASNQLKNIAASQAADDNLQTPVPSKSQSPSQVNQESTPVANQPTDSSNKTSVAKKRSQLLLEASLEKIKSFTPRLEGSPEAVIDLEDSDDDMPAVVLNPGLRKLMDRFAQHTKKAAGKKKRQVEISIVSKEVDKDGKEDLKFDKVVTTLDGEEEIDSSLQVPGAKLLKLKDNLQATMRLKREEARQKRKEAYRLDNEDLSGDEDEDGEKEGKGEAELTDQTDTDYDPEEDNIKDDFDDGPDDVDEEEEEEEEEMDEEEDYEEPVRKKFEFGDEEAEVDDDEEEEYEEDGEDDTDMRKPTKKEDDDEKAAMASGEESSDDEDDMGRRKITPTRIKRKKRLVLDEDEDDEEDKMSLKIPEDEPEKKETKSLLRDPITEPSETSRLSATSSAKTSCATKTSSMSVGFNLDGSKTMDMFDSNTNLTSNADTDNKPSDLCATDGAGESIGFSWSAIKEHKEENKDEGSQEPGTLKLDSASNSLDTSFEMFGSMIPAHQPGGGMRHAAKSANDDTSDQFTPFSKQKSLLSSIPKSTSKLSELTLPVEDSQDLFREESPLPSLAVSDSQRESQSFHFSFEEDETQSQFLDENGFLNVRPSFTKPKPMAKKLFSGESAATQNNMDELLGLCSGQFSGGSQAPRASSPNNFGGTGPFSQITKGLGETQGGMDELLQLCSGTFAKTQAQDKDTEVTNPNQDKEDNKDEDGSEASFHLISDNEGFHSDNEEDDKAKFKALSSDEEDEIKKEADEDAEEKSKKRRRIKLIGSSDEEEDEQTVKVKKFKSLFTQQKKSKMVKSNFVEAEAELSGSEYDSDENYDAEELGDELEDEVADQEDVGDEEDLRNQINKAHMKAVDDDDARQLRIYKELLLPDGDLHSDGKGRQRQFKWRNLNYEDSMTDLFTHNSDGEAEDDQDEDTQWRMKRYEREQWLKENKKQPDKVDNHEDEDDVMPAEEENSQFVKFMKSAVQRNKKTKVTAPSAADNTSVQQPDKEKDKRVGTPKAIKTRGKFHGSFLHRKDEVAKIAANTVANPNGPRMSRNFVFQAVSPDGQKTESRSQVKRSTSVSGSSTSMAAPKAKRPRMERSQSNMSQNSIFNHM